MCEDNPVTAKSNRKLLKRDEILPDYPLHHHLQQHFPTSFRVTLTHHFLILLTSKTFTDHNLNFSSPRTFKMHCSFSKTVFAAFSIISIASAGPIAAREVCGAAPTGTVAQTPLAQPTGIGKSLYSHSSIMKTF